MKTQTRETYRKRIERVLEFITTHEGKTPDIHRLAEEAMFSPYHFHRVYVAMMGETVADTVRRKRLHSAAVKLTSSASPIARIASESGYSSVQAFARAFREGYGAAPGQYRLHGQISHAIEQAKPNQRKASAMFKLSDVKIESLPSVSVIALRHQGDYQQIGSTFERLMAWAAGKEVRPDQQRSFGIYYDDPLSKPASELVSDACLEAPAGMTSDGDVRLMEIPAGRCATYTFTGPYSELEKPYRWMYDTWLAQSGEEVGNAPPYEEYLNDARSTPPTQLLTRICIPLND